MHIREDIHVWTSEIVIFCLTKCSEAHVYEYSRPQLIVWLETQQSDRAMYYTNPCAFSGPSCKPDKLSNRRPETTLVKCSEAHVPCHLHSQMISRPATLGASRIMCFQQDSKGSAPEDVNPDRGKARAKSIQIFSAMFTSPPISGRSKI